ncbi:MAG: cell division protein FtsA, partial [Hyphomicrobium sp.]
MRAAQMSSMKARLNKMRFTNKNFHPSKGVIGVLDVGSFKTVCLIAKVDKKRIPERISGVGISRSLGIKSGVIVDISAAQECIRKAVADAERMAGVQLSEIDIALNCGHLKSQAFKISLCIPSGNIDAASLILLNQKATDYARKEGRYLTHINPVTYQLKGTSTSTLHPIGLCSDALNGFYHAVTADVPAVTNLFQTLDRSYLSPDTVIPGPLASALVVTEEDERNSGVIVIDIGSGQTGISAFTGGRYMHSATVSMGGGEITLDIAHVLRTPLEEAERIKTLYGTILSAQSNQHDLFTFMSREGGELAEQTATLSDLARIIRSRGNNLLNLAYERLSSSGLLNNFLGSIVLCGGTSRLPGMTSLAESI